MQHVDVGSLVSFLGALLLDEPTAALDSESEREVQAAFDALRIGRTRMVSAQFGLGALKADRLS